ncbi:MAG: hypothetical protein OXH00_09400 [Candidatus Poribacteria bacterium]|nr:hypothetical protein [Candidatus Poribacteria bacterium]
MKICSTFHALVLVMTGLTFSAPFVTIAQQIFVQTEAVTAAEADANKDVNKLLCFSAGCVLSALFFLPSPYGYFFPPTGIIGSYSYRPSPPPSRLIGKSPEYIATYTSAYESKRGTIQAQWTSAGCLSGCVVAGSLAVGVRLGVVAAQE